MDKHMANAVELLKKYRVARKALFALIGGGAGFAYYYYIGCASGTCPITGSPYISTLYGMMMGFLISMNSKKKEGCVDGTC
jgi:hypothetical protein